MAGWRRTRHCAALKAPRVPSQADTTASNRSSAVVTDRPVYALRSIRFLELWECRGWPVKIYGIGLERPPQGAGIVAPIFVDAAKEALDCALATGAPDPGASPRAGFAILHEGQLARWLILDLWHNWVLLHHVLHRADRNQIPVRFQPVSDGLCACTWELRVIGYERDAWLNTMLAPPEGPDLESYLRSRLFEDC